MQALGSGLSGRGRNEDCALLTLFKSLAMKAVQEELEQASACTQIAAEFEQILCRICQFGELPFSCPVIFQLEAACEVDARNIDGSTPLCDACASGSIECVKLLLSYGAKVNPPLYTASPLHEACMSGSSECVRLLIDVGANLEAHDCHFGTPLHVACAREHLDCVKVLLKAGANVNAAKLHETALHHAAKVRNVDLIEMLIEFGGNIYARDNRGKKPSDYTWSSSAPAKCFEHYEKTPLTLSQLCRVTLRRATGVRGLEKIAKLNIPSRLIDYLSYN
uniref:Ankyrin repeat and SOCS box containing 13 n=1 Tax=Equus caballus TaxID=9796 RepID=A0A9L0SGR5_HORSE